MTSDRFEFASPAWFEMFAGCVRELPVSGDGARVSFSELYRDVPADIAGHDGPVGWHVVVEAGAIEFGPVPDVAADIVIECDYGFARDMLQEVDSTDESARREQKAAYAAAAAAGAFEVRGDLKASPSVLRPLHDLLAAKTRQGR